jgi:hypothetical protein
LTFSVDKTQLTKEDIGSHTLKLSIGDKSNSDAIKGEFTINISINKDGESSESGDEDGEGGSESVEEESGTG